MGELGVRSYDESLPLQGEKRCLVGLREKESTPEGRRGRRCQTAMADGA
jgi:hypothetical protein